MADDTNNGRKEADEQYLHRDRLWAILSCLGVVVILCVGVGSIAVSAGIPVLASPENAQIQQQASSNTLTIRSTDEERVSYSVVVSGTLQAGAGVDAENAEQPDAVSRSAAVGSVAQGGVDNFTFTGRITRLTLSGEAANVTVNGKQINPAKYQSTVSPQTTTAATTTATATPTSTPAPTPTLTATAVPTVKTTPTVRYRPTVTATPVPTPTVTATASPSTPQATPTSETASVPPSPPSQQSGGGGSGILGWIASNLFLFGGLIILVILLIAVLVERANRKPRF